MSLHRYLNTEYVRGGRTYPQLDCWGLVRLARSELFGRDKLPELADTRPCDFRRITHAVDSVSTIGGMSTCLARPGAIATAWRASLCVHVGLCVFVDGRLRVLETDTPHGACLTSISNFTSRYTRVLFYDDKDISRTVSE